MRSLSFAVSGLALVLMTSTVMAREKTGKASKKPMDPQARAELYQKLATPGEPHRQLSGLAGTWKTVTKEWTDPGTPSAESTGSAEMKMLLGDRFLQQEYTGQMMGQPFSGIGIEGYDNLRKKYVTVWMSSSGTGIFTMEGTASEDGRTITLKGQHPEPGGHSMQHRAVWKIPDDDHQTYEMYGPHKGGAEMKTLEITYTRQK